MACSATGSSTVAGSCPRISVYGQCRVPVGPGRNDRDSRAFERVEGVDNLYVALPSLAVKAWANAEDAGRLVGPLGPPTPHRAIPYAGALCASSANREDRAGIGWSTWNELIARHSPDPPSANDSTASWRSLIGQGAALGHHRKERRPGSGPPARQTRRDRRPACRSDPSRVRRASEAAGDSWTYRIHSSARNAPWNHMAWSRLAPEVTSRSQSKPCPSSTASSSVMGVFAEAGVARRNRLRHELQTPPLEGRIRSAC